MGIRALSTLVALARGDAFIDARDRVISHSAAGLPFVLLSRGWMGVDDTNYSTVLERGTASNPSFQGYANGNSDPSRGFGYITISVGDIEKACARFESLGVRFQKKLTDGKMKNIAFILDPDGCAAFLLVRGRGTDAHLTATGSKSSQARSSHPSLREAWNNLETK